MFTLTDDITQQARQGNIVALVQILNSQLAPSGVQTRGIFVDGVLQLLCEATQAELLERYTLVNQIRDILESISPRHIRRVNINSRILQKQQLLWFEEINRSPQTQLLWSEEILLKKPPLPQQLIGIINDGKLYAQTPTFSTENPPENPQPNQQFNRGLAAGMAVSLAALLVSFAVYQGVNLQDAPAEELSSTPTATPPTTPTPENPPTDQQKFAQAVRLAQQGVTAGEVAQTAEEWAEIAEIWGKAADLMEAVSPQFSRYPTAQDRASVYRQNQEVALQEAAKNSELPPY